MFLRNGINSRPENEIEMEIPFCAASISEVKPLSTEGWSMRAPLPKNCDDAMDTKPRHAVSGDSAVQYHR